MKQLNQDFFRAITDNNVEAAKFYIRLGATIHIKEREGIISWLALTHAAWHNHIGMVKLLLDAGADVNMLDGDGWTALMAASYKGYTDIAVLLLNVGANMNAQTNEGWTALMYASCRGSVDIVKLLMNKGADERIRNNSNRTALMIARTSSLVSPSNAYSTIVKLLQWEVVNEPYRKKNETT